MASPPTPRFEVNLRWMMMVSFSDKLYLLNTIMELNSRFGFNEYLNLRFNVREYLILSNNLHVKFCCNRKFKNITHKMTYTIPNHDKFSFTNVPLEKIVNAAKSSLKTPVYPMTTIARGVARKEN